jgi:hypothetical protein
MTRKDTMILLKKYKFNKKVNANRIARIPFLAFGLMNLILHSKEDASHMPSDT